MRSSWVCAAVSTILFAAPVLGTLKPRDRPGADDSTAFVTLDIPDDNEGQAKPLTLRLDIGESQVACGHGNLTINGQKLIQDGNGNGQGTLAGHQHGNFTADWAFSCNDKSPDMSLKLQVTGIDGLETEPFNFSASFTQTRPRQIWILDGVAVVNHIHKLPQEHKPQSDEPESTLQDQLHAQIHDLDVLRIQARQLENAILAREAELAQLLGQKKASAPTSIQHCDSLKCIFEALGSKFRGVAEKIGGDVNKLKDFIAYAQDYSWPAAAADHDYWYNDDETREELYNAQSAKDAFKNHRGKWNPAGQVPLTQGQIPNKADDHTRPRHQSALLITIALSVITLCLLAPFSIILLLLHRRHLRRRRRSSSSQVAHPIDDSRESEKVLFSERPRRQSHSERRARRKARRQAIKEYVRCIFTRWCDRQQSPPPPDEGVNQESSTIDEEFASFREAVSVVDSIVAAEEGRTRQVPRYEECVPDEAYREYDDDDDESLPPYESEEDESPPVVDGFRYHAGMNDRLGYGK